MPDSVATDTERLDFLITNAAFVYCLLGVFGVGGGNGGNIVKGKGDTPRAAIDDAIARMKSS